MQDKYFYIEHKNQYTPYDGTYKDYITDDNEEEMYFKILNSKVPADIDKIAITVTIYDAPARKQNFGQVSNAYVRVARISGPSDTVGTEVLRFDLGEEFSIETAIVVCEIYRSGNEWKFNAVGQGVVNASRVDKLVEMYK